MGKADWRWTIDSRQMGLLSLLEGVWLTVVVALAMWFEIADAVDGGAVGWTGIGYWGVLVPLFVSMWVVGLSNVRTRGPAVRLACILFSGSSCVMLLVATGLAASPVSREMPAWSSVSPRALSGALALLLLPALWCCFVSCRWAWGGRARRRAMHPAVVRTAWWTYVGSGVLLAAQGVERWVQGVLDPSLAHLQVGEPFVFATVVLFFFASRTWFGVDPGLRPELRPTGTACSVLAVAVAVHLASAALQLTDDCDWLSRLMRAIGALLLLAVLYWCLSRRASRSPLRSEASIRI